MKKTKTSEVKKKPAPKSPLTPAKSNGLHPGGRPTKYKPEYCLAVEYMARVGMIESDMADKLGIAMSTFSLWKEYPEFSESLKIGKEAPDDLVERSLFTRATGYTFDSEKVMSVSDGAQVGAHIERIPIKEHCPPDVTAQIFWLKNRRPDRWREKQEIEHSGAITLTIDADDAKL